MDMGENLTPSSTWHTSKNNASLMAALSRVAFCEFHLQAASSQQAKLPRPQGVWTQPSIPHRYGKAQMMFFLLASHK